MSSESKTNSDTKVKKQIHEKNLDQKKNLMKI